MTPRAHVPVSQANATIIDTHHSHPHLTVIILCESSAFMLPWTRKTRVCHSACGKDLLYPATRTYAPPGAAQGTPRTYVRVMKSSTTRRRWKAVEAPRPSPQRWTQGDGEDQGMGEPQCKHRRMPASAELSSLSRIGEGEPTVVGTEDDASEDASNAGLIKTALSVSSQVDEFD